MSGRSVRSTGTQDSMPKGHQEQKGYMHGRDLKAQIRGETNREQWPVAKR